MSLITSSNNSENRLTYCGENCEAEKTGLDEIPVNRVGLQRETVRYRSGTMKGELTDYDTDYLWSPCLAHDVYPRLTGLRAGSLVLLQSCQHVLPHQTGLVGEALQEQPPLRQQQGLVGLLVIQLSRQLQ